MDRWLLAGVLVWAAVVAAPPDSRAQQAPASGPHDAAAEPPPSPIRFDAIVTDHRGRRVLDLQPEDFDVKVNGVSQPLKGLDVRTSPQPRVFAIYLDEYHVRHEASARVREAVGRFIAAGLRPDDRVVLLKPLDRVTNLRFTTERSALAAAVGSFEGRKEDLQPRSPFEEQFIGRAPEAVAAARAQIVTLALTEIALQLGELEADRAALVLVSEGFERRTRAQSRRQGRLPDLQGVIRAASRYHFSIYALSPSDVEDEGPGGETLAWLAAQTGGVSIVAGAPLARQAAHPGLEDGLTQVASDMEGYYALRLPPPANNGRFHRVEVAAKRQGLAVRARPGFWAPLSSEVRALLARSAPSPLRPARALRRSPLIDAWVGLRAADVGALGVAVWWTPAERDAGSPGGPVALEIRARSEQGRLLYQGRVASMTAGADVARFDAPPGRLELDMTVVAADGAELDTDVRDVQVPVLAGRLALLPVEILSARTMPEHRRNVEGTGRVPTRERVFTRLERLVIRPPVWRAAGGPVQVTAQVLNRRGQIMRPIDPLDASAEGLPGFDLPLAWLAPGDYYVEIRARQGEHAVAERVPFRITP